jgi:hypothetical protein
VEEAIREPLSYPLDLLLRIEISLTVIVRAATTRGKPRAADSTKLNGVQSVKGRAELRASAPSGFAASRAAAF